MDFSFAQSALQDFNLLIEESQFVVTPDQLRPEDVSFVLLVRVELFEFIVVLADVLDDLRLHFLLHLLRSQFTLLLKNMHFKVLLILRQSLFLSCYHAERVMLIGECLVLTINLIFKV